MAKKTVKSNAPKTLEQHIKNVINGTNSFENVFQSLTKMILGDTKKIEKIFVNGKNLYDYKSLREGVSIL